MPTAKGRSKGIYTRIIGWLADSIGFFSSSSKTVGVKDGKRYEGWAAIIRAVNTTDAMSATIEEIPYSLIHHITYRITHEVEGINRVMVDVTPKPIGTIEFE